ncbi:hypothetical protein QWY97_09010 [Vibrio cortegadensis]|uniref:hypothetical protein n=1 Tax=Vibrio cortegadensis TaxID=1328770 RepID=UPI0021C2A0A3|nr:hypothetical protein [Vibrio cortegadensis]MDN3697495.1 hypothetical protein [Vibrio cortegadensis]
MSKNKEFDAVIQKTAKVNVIINAAINGLVPILAMGSMIYVPVMGLGGMVQDLVLMNFFLIFFVFFFARLECINYAKKNGIPGIAYDQQTHASLTKYLQRSTFKNFVVMYVKYMVTWALPVVLLCLAIYPEAGVPLADFVFIKTTFSVFLANRVAMLGGQLGAIDQDSIKLVKAKMAKA